MSKVVNWGHWVVAVVFAIGGGVQVGSALANVPRLLRDHPDDITYRLVFDLLYLFLLICAWGILKWRTWSRPTGIVLAAIGMTMVGIATVTEVQLRMGFDFFQMAAGLAICFSFIWFLLPAVRSEYSRRNQVA